MQQRSAMEKAADTALNQQPRPDFDPSDAVAAVGQGIRLQNFAQNNPIIFRINLQGLVPEKALNAPATESCRAQGCAQNPIVAIACRDSECGIVWQNRNDPSEVRFAQGPPTDVLSPQVTTKLKDLGFL